MARLAAKDVFAKLPDCEDHSPHHRITKRARPDRAGMTDLACDRTPDHSAPHPFPVKPCARPQQKART